MIKLENVTKIYPDGTKAVDDVTLEIEKGEFCVLLGPSGCGKTTSLKMINRLISLSQGKIYVDGRDVYQMDVNQLRRSMGYAIQEIGLFPHMTVEQNVTTVPRLLGWSKARCRERTAELLDLVGLSPPETFMRRFPNELSGGQKQRVGVARCLGADPPILLMDEPFGAIDPITRERLQDEFLRIQDEIRKTIAFVTHDIHEAVKMGDTIALMRDGILVQHAPPAEMLAHPKDSFVEDFVGSDRALKALQLMRVRDVMDETPPKVRIDESLETARGRMQELGVNFLAVVNEDERFEGWVNRRVLRRSGEQVKDVMMRYTVTGRRDTPVNEALSLMLGSAIGNLGVVDRRDKLIGVVTFRSLSEAIQASYSEDEDPDEAHAERETTA